MTDIELKLTPVAIGMTCSDVTFATEKQHILGNMICQLKAYFCSERQRPFCYNVPSSWWQHFKQEVFPQWLLKRFPVKNKTVEITVATVYPFLKTQIPPDLQGRTVTVLCNDRPIGQFFSDTDGIEPFMWREKAKEMLFSERFRMSDRCPCCSRLMFEK